MKILSKICCLYLALLIASLNIPIYNYEDANNDCRIDMVDVLIAMQCIAKTADNINSFKSEVGKAISVAKVAAGLKTVISPLKNKQSKFNNLTFDFPYLKSNLPIIIINNQVSFIYDTDESFISFHISPDIPPPIIFEIS